MYACFILIKLHSLIHFIWHISVVLINCIMYALFSICAKTSTAANLYLLTMYLLSVLLLLLLSEVYTYFLGEFMYNVCCNFIDVFIASIYFSSNFLLNDINSAASKFFMLHVDLKSIVIILHMKI